jgi:hypothetical protein
MSKTPFTNIKTCNGGATALTRLYYANGVNLCHSTYRKLIDINV